MKYGAGLTQEQRLARLEQLVPVPEYTAPTFAGTWSNYGFTWRDAGYAKLPGGLVTVCGLVARSGAAGGTIFTLPVGYRPSESHIYWLTDSIAVARRIDVNADGTIELQVGSDPGAAIGYLSLAGINFLAEA